MTGFEVPDPSAISHASTHGASLMVLNPRPPIVDSVMSGLIPDINRLRHGGTWDTAEGVRQGGTASNDSPS